MDENTINLLKKVVNNCLGEDYEIRESFFPIVKNGKWYDVELIITPHVEGE